MSKYISKISAAQRLGESVKKIEELIFSKKIKVNKEDRVDLDSLLVYSGLGVRSRKTAGKSGRPPKVLAKEEVIKILALTDEAYSMMVQENILELWVMSSGGKLGVTQRSVTAFLDEKKQEKEDAPPEEEERKDTKDKAKKEENKRVVEERTTAQLLADNIVEVGIPRKLVEELISITQMETKVMIYESMQKFERKIV